MSFIEKIKTEMYDAMKSGEKDKAGALRTLLAKLKDKEINTRKELSEQDGLTVIKTLVKQRKESVAMYEKANRPELADKEKNELIACSKFDLFSNDKKKLSSMVEKKLGKKPFIFSNISRDGIEDLVMGLFKQCLNNNDK